MQARRHRFPLQAVLLFAGSALGCRGVTGYPPQLAPSVDAVQAKRMECANQMRLPDVGQLVGCRRVSGDTTFFLYRDRSGNLIAVGRRLHVPPGAVTATFDSLAEALTVDLGVAPTWCEVPATEFWHVREARWTFEAWQYSLRQAVPTSGSSSSPNLTVATHRGTPNCATSFGVPFFDRHSRP